MSKTFKLLIVGDLHLGFQQYGSFQRALDFSSVLPQIENIARQEKIDAGVLLGDIFNSSEPPAHACRALRKFAERLNQDCRNWFCISGNHDRQKHNLDGGVSRVDSLTDLFLRPTVDANTGSPSPQILGDGRVEIVALDWMPANKLAETLEKLPPGIDFLFLHQSLAGLVPNVPQTEVKLEQLAGKAKCVCIGDTHIVKVLTAGETTIVSAGSTELCSSSEGAEKSVSIVDYDLENHRVLGVTHHPLKTRKVMKLRAFDELSFNDADNQLRRAASENPLVFLTHNQVMKPLVEARMPEWAALGMNLVIPSATVQVDERESYVATRDSADREMETIIAERLIGHPIEQAAAVAMWKTPGAMEEIINHIESSIRTAITNENQIA